MPKCNFHPSYSALYHISHTAWPYRPQDIRGGFCRMVLLSVSQLFRGSFFRTFMTKRKRIKIRWRWVGWKCETAGLENTAQTGHW